MHSDRDHRLTSSSRAHRSGQGTVWHAHGYHRPVRVAVRNNVVESGILRGTPMIFAHGFGCDQAMWRFVEPSFRASYRTVLFDYVGAGNSDLSAYDPARYPSNAVSRSSSTPMGCLRHATAKSSMATSGSRLS